MRLCWHGWPGTHAEYLELTLTDRYLANDELSDLIERTNEAGSTRPKDDR